MRLDTRDQDYIWSPSSIVKVDTKNGTHVTLRYDGWGDAYDERVAWNSDRLALPFSFTKRVKCLVNILYKPKANPKKAELEKLPPGARKTYSDLWPCTVQLRMPHPAIEGLEDENHCLYAEEFLRAEGKVFIQPYAPHLLPPLVQKNNAQDGGSWLNTKRLRMWTSEPNKLGVLPKNFVEAYEIAKNDKETPGVLSQSVFEKGSLLKAIYRVHSRAGSQLRDGALYEASELSQRLQEQDALRQDTKMKPPQVVQIRQEGAEQQQELTSAEIDLPRAPPAPVPPPVLPPPIQITELIHPGCGIKRCEVTNQWTASVCLGSGNSLFLGSFPTQTQAYQATRIAAGEDVEIETDLRAARLEDLRAVPIEAVVQAQEEQYKPSIHDFSLHHYSLDQIRYETYQVQQRAEGANSSEMQSKVVADKNAADPPRKNKRKGKPRKVDMAKRCYVAS